MSANTFRRRAGRPPAEAGGSRVDRRSFLRLAGGVAALGAVGMAGVRLSSGAVAAGAHPQTDRMRFWALGGTDGWTSLPSEAAPMPPIWPDAYATDYAPGTNLYGFGFRDISHMHHVDSYDASTGLGNVSLSGNPMDYKNGAIASAPLLWCVAHEDVYVRLYNLGLLLRPDLSDSHTVHWHGFPNQVPYFDGVPEPSISVPIGSYATYRYIPTEPGTYMYHCHFEDVEHVQMGMQGMVFVRPRGWSETDRSTWSAYGDDDTRYDREYTLHLNEVDVIAHYNDSHLQVSNWVEYHPTFGVINGRSYPDTIAPGTDPDNPPDEDDPLYRLRFQPLSALIQAQPGERVLLRISHLGFKQHTLVLPGLPMRVVGIDGKYVGPGRAGYQDFGHAQQRADARFTTNTLSLGPGEARDVILEIPDDFPVGDYELYDRDLGYAAAASGDSSLYGGMRTIVSVRNGLPDQSGPNETF